MFSLIKTQQRFENDWTETKVRLMKGFNPQKRFIIMLQSTPPLWRALDKSALESSLSISTSPICQVLLLLATSLSWYSRSRLDFSFERMEIIKLWPSRWFNQRRNLRPFSKRLDKECSWMNDFFSSNRLKMKRLSIFSFPPLHFSSNNAFSQQKLLFRAWTLLLTHSTRFPLSTLTLINLNKVPQLSTLKRT